ncbi:MAG TPA: carboxypeptidase-like regulatory domain-containing protein [Candidatus Acidoferrales bacterium]|nr:carboxypeptidase-like regulatory domain-containing protein [Candidatus Acidoferrales bacterium]
MKYAMVGITCALLLLPALVAQKKGEPITRSVQGVVTDQGDAPVASAVVQLENTKTQQIRSYITKEDGMYYFYDLNTDTDYKLHADRQGASSPTKTLTSFDSRKQVVINLKLNKK